VTLKRFHIPIAVLTLSIIRLAAAATQVTSADNTDAAWNTYLHRDTNVRPAYQFPHASCFRAAASANDLPETLLLAVARGESDFEETARSKANAHGVMQIQWPGTAKHLGIHRLSDLYDPCTNIDAGARYLKELLARYNQNIHLALAAYNYGPGRIETDGTTIPTGAKWYSAYIFRHMSYILGNRANRPRVRQSLYSELGRTTLISFVEPYRAEAFVNGIEQSVPDVQLDWFRKDVGKFVVVMLYDGKEQFQSGSEQLARSGFPLD